MSKGEAAFSPRPCPSMGVVKIGLSDLVLAVLQKCLKKGRLKMLFEEWG